VRRPIPREAGLRVYHTSWPGTRRGGAVSSGAAPRGARAAAGGKGRDFEKLREYIPGDSLDDIHWKATAKRGHPVTKVFQIERTQEVYVILDASRLSGAPSGSPPRAALERLHQRGSSSWRSRRSARATCSG